MRAPTVALAAAAVIVAVPLVGDRRLTAASPTFNRDIAPIVFSKCAACHRPKQAAPMPLLSYSDARPWAQAIKKKLEEQGATVELK